MLVIRPIQTRDLNDLYRIAVKAGCGMTSLPQDKNLLEEKISLSTNSFQSKTFSFDDYFLLVLEDTEKKRVIGTAALYSRTHKGQAFYAYKISRAIHYSHALDREIRTDLLQLDTGYTDHSEAGSLFVDPEYRGNGHWLGKTRFIFANLFSERFNDYLIAELRGYIPENGQSPFWDGLGRHFFDMNFDEADNLCAGGSNMLIAELMPRHPVYTCLLPTPARQAIGKPHNEGVRAFELLKAEGFAYEGFIDVFDGGPILKGKINALHSAQHMRQLPFVECRKAVSGKKAAPADRYLVTNTRLPTFRATQLTLPTVSDSVALPPEIIDTLQLTPDQTVCLLKTG